MSDVVYGVVCPVCNGDTQVTETRRIANGLRRRRACLSVSCSGRISTIEIACARKSIGRGGSYVAVPAAQIALLRRTLDDMIPLDQGQTDVAG